MNMYLATKENSDGMTDEHIDNFNARQYLSEARHTVIMDIITKEIRKDETNWMKVLEGMDAWRLLKNAENHLSEQLFRI